MTDIFPTPPIKPFERLQLTHGTLVNVEHWYRAHQEPFDKQRFLYQSLYLSGIVKGLNVRAITTQEVSTVAGDLMSVVIQPGIAIDYRGNPIIVDKPLLFQIKTKLKKSDFGSVYIVAKYRDPDELEGQQSDEFVRETFRIDEKITPPDYDEVKLCHIPLHVDTKIITNAIDPLYPEYGNIDLRRRLCPKPRPEAFVRVAQVKHSDPDSSRNFYNLFYLLRAVEKLHPQLQGAEYPEQVDWLGDLEAYDLLYLTGREKLSLNATELAALEKYLGNGGTLLVDVSPEATELIESVQVLASQGLDTLLELVQKTLDHPLRTNPFLFGKLPSVNRQEIELFCNKGLILAIGNLASAWGLAEIPDLPQSTIEEFQKLGVNILNYAIKRRQLMSGSKDEVELHHIDDNHHNWKTKNLVPFPQEYRHC